MLGFLGIFGVCVPVVPPVVTFPFSEVDVACEVVFCDSDCEFVEPQTVSLSRKRKVIAILESGRKRRWR